jgi:hypothetical protein
MAFAYGDDTYVANTDFKDGMLLKIPMQKAGFKTETSPGCRWDTNRQIDNDINMKVIMAKESLEKRNGISKK